MRICLHVQVDRQLSHHHRCPSHRSAWKSSHTSCTVITPWSNLEGWFRDRYPNQGNPTASPSVPFSVANVLLFGVNWQDLPFDFSRRAFATSTCLLSTSELPIFGIPEFKSSQSEDFYQLLITPILSDFWPPRLIMDVLELLWCKLLISRRNPATAFVCRGYQR